MKNKMKTIRTKTTWMLGMLLIALSTSFTSCSNDDDNSSSVSLIEAHNLPGTYNIEISSAFMGSTPIASGTHQATMTNEGNGILRLQFGGFNTPPMPFVMDVDVQMTFSESDQKLIVHNVDGNSYFDANVPTGVELDPNSLPPGLELPPETLENGLHSNGNSIVSGEYKMVEETMQFDLDIDPAIGLPIIVTIQTIEKLN